LSSTFYPEGGPYSSTDKKVIERHMLQLTQAHVGVLVLGWMPQEKQNKELLQSGIDKQTILLILDAAVKFNLKVAFHLLHFPDITTEDFESSVKYVIDEYGNHPAFYRTNVYEFSSSPNKPLFYVEGVQHKPPFFWRELLSKKKPKEN